MRAENEFKLWVQKQSNDRSYALDSKFYSNPANIVKFEREKQEYLQDIKGLLNEWAGYYSDKYGIGYPSQSAFCTERVQTSNRSTESYRAIPEEIVRLNDIIEMQLPCRFKIILRMQYRDKRKQSIKAAILGIPQQVFSQRLLFIHEQLHFLMFGEKIS